MTRELQSIEQRLQEVTRLRKKDKLAAKKAAANSIPANSSTQ